MLTAPEAPVGTCYRVLFQFCSFSFAVDRWLVLPAQLDPLPWCKDREQRAFCIPGFLPWCTRILCLTQNLVLKSPLHISTDTVTSLPPLGNVPIPVYCNWNQQGRVPSVDQAERIQLQDNLPSISFVGQVRKQRWNSLLEITKMGAEAISYIKYCFPNSKKMSVNIYLHEVWQFERVLISAIFCV